MVSPANQPVSATVGRSTTVLNHGSETSVLLRRYHEGGDTGARQRLVELYLPLVESLTRRYSRTADEHDDLYQVGCIGLINAIDRFDPERGEELAAFAVPNIAGEIRRYLRDRGGTVRLPRRVLELRPAALRAQRELATRLGREPTPADVARETGADEPDVALALDAGAGRAVELTEDAGELGALDSADDRLFLADATRGLDDRERQILQLRYVEDLEPAEVALRLGISRRQLSRSTQAALTKLRLGLEGADLPAPAPEPKIAPVAVRQDERYLDQPYHIELVRDADGGGWSAQVEEWPGCEARGATADEAARGIEDAMRAWVDDARANRREVPKPRSAASHSGRLLVRMPQSLHSELARAAEREDVSLNQFITSSLASAVGWRRADGAQPEPAAPEAAESAPDRARAAIVANIAVLVLVAAIAVVLLVIAVSKGL
jgi:RNA polymerase sigma-B factor